MEDVFVVGFAFIFNFILLDVEAQIQVYCTHHYTIIQRILISLFQTFTYISMNVKKPRYCYLGFLFCKIIIRLYVCVATSIG